jgi:hypothetical protein
VTSSGLPVTSSGLPVTLIGRPVIMTSEAGEEGGDEVTLPPPNLIPNATSLLKPGGREPSTILRYCVIFVLLDSSLSLSRIPGSAYIHIL